VLKCVDDVIFLLFVKCKLLTFVFVQSAFFDLHLKTYSIAHSVPLH
jgi:hypothetical protein